MIVARLIHARRLGGFHFNDSRYGDDDLDAGSIDPFRLFLIFNELVDAAWRLAPDLQPAHMLDQSHNVTDSIESLIGPPARLAGLPPTGQAPGSYSLPPTHAGDARARCQRPPLVPAKR